MKAILKCWDAEEERWIFENNEDITPEFTYKNGKWSVRYTEEITICPDGIEMDVPVWREVENPKVCVHFLHDTEINFYLSIPLTPEVENLHPAIKKITDNFFPPIVNPYYKTKA